MLPSSLSISSFVFSYLDLRLTLFDGYARFLRGDREGGLGRSALPAALWMFLSMPCFAAAVGIRMCGVHVAVHSAGPRPSYPT